MTGWQIVVLILGFLAFIGFESYMNVLKERVSVLSRTVTVGDMTSVIPKGSMPEISALDEQRLTNGDS